MKMIATILDARFSGLATEDHEPVVVPIRARYKWAFWRNNCFLWAVVQPKREVIGQGIVLVWRHIAVFTDRSNAVTFLAEMNNKETP